MPSNTLLAQLRRVIKDTHPSMNAIGLGVSEATVTNAVLELTQDRLVFVCSGGSVRPFDIDLTDSSYETVGKLFQQFQRMPGMAVSLDKDADPDHLSTDLEPFGPTDIRVQQRILRHHLFSDFELNEILRRALSRHNPSMTLNSIPPGEVELVFTLAQALVARTRASDAAKRKGTDTSVQSLLEIARAFEDQYTNDSRRLKRTLESPREAPSNRVGEGDVVVGKTWRRSLRNGHLAPIGVATGPEPVTILASDDGDDEDTSVRVRWLRSRDHHFAIAELWMDTQPDVKRITTNLIGREDSRVYTATKVGSWAGPNWMGGTDFWRSWAESIGELTSLLTVQDLEPETDYYFRLYCSNVNGEYAASEVVKHRTKALRVLFDDTAGPVSPGGGPAGTLVTYRFTGAPFNSTTQLFLGGKPLTVTILSPTQVTAVVPSFVQKGSKDAVVVSQNGLKDLAAAAFTVT